MYLPLLYWFLFQYLTTVNAIIGLFGSLSFVAAVVTAIVAWKKQKPESNKIIVESAQIVVGLQTKTIETLRKELDELTAKNETLEKENRDLRTRLDDMEDRLQALTQRTTDIEQHGTNG